MSERSALAATSRGLGRFERRDWLVAMGLLLVSLATRVPFRSQFAYNWDSAEFVIAVRDYNLAIEQPHMPGYFLYVMLGRVVDFFVHDAHAALVWLSIMAGAGLVALLYLLGSAMFGRRVGVIAALLTWCSPQVWFHSCVALTYIVDAALACTLALVCWRARQRNSSWLAVAGIGLLLGLCAGVRPQSYAMLMFLVLYSLWRATKQRGLKLGTVFAISLGLWAIWLAGMAALSGGLPVVIAAEHRSLGFLGRKTLMGGGLDAPLTSITFVAATCWNGLLLAVGALVFSLGYRMLHPSSSGVREWDAQNKQAIQMVAAWGLPIAILATVIGFTDQPGHALGLIPPLILLAAAALAAIRSPFVRITTVAVICVTNAAAFLWMPKEWHRAFVGMGRTAQDIRAHDEAISQTVQTVRQRFSPQETILYHAVENIHFGLRHFQLYLPEFRQYQLAYDPVLAPPKSHPLLSVVNGKLAFADRESAALSRTAVLLVPPDSTLAVFKPYLDISHAEPVGDATTVYVLSPKP
jgi:4-amino-4-deoxy-L-arabinose transferase-like glycosyltransferase